MSAPDAADLSRLPPSTKRAVELNETERFVLLGRDQV
jgi:hypothetical protein